MKLHLLSHTVEDITWLDNMKVLDATVYENVFVAFNKAYKESFEG